jgi:hypothetical protein
MVQTRNHELGESQQISSQRSLESDQVERANPTEVLCPLKTKSLDDSIGFRGEERNDSVEANLEILDSEVKLTKTTEHGIQMSTYFLISFCLPVTNKVQFDPSRKLK